MNLLNTHVQSQRLYHVSKFQRVGSKQRIILLGVVPTASFLPELAKETGADLSEMMIKMSLVLGAAQVDNILEDRDRFQGAYFFSQDDAFYLTEENCKLPGVSWDQVVKLHSAPWNEGFLS